MARFNTDPVGHIIIDDSMSEELKAKVKAYNDELDKPQIVYEELSDEEIEALPDDDNDNYEYKYYTDDDDDDSSGGIAESSIGQEQLDSLNDLFN